MRLVGTGSPVSPQGGSAARPAASVAARAPERVSPAGSEPSPRRNPNIARLVAGVVPGRIDFSGDVPKPAAQDAISLYARPADRNAAATAVNAGRLIDVRG